MKQQLDRIVDRRVMERAFVVRIIRQLIAANERTCSTDVVNEWERWGDFFIDRRNAFPIAQRILREMEASDELTKSCFEIPSGQDVRNWYELVG